MCVLRRVADNLDQECLESSQLRWLTVCQVVLLQMDSIWLSIPAGGVLESTDRGSEGVWAGISQCAEGLVRGLSHLLPFMQALRPLDSAWSLLHSLCGP